MATKNPALWRSFYTLAAQFRDLAPWKWMWDGQLFGVKDPETGLVGWCSIMGGAGEHYALGIYKGEEGLSSYWNISDIGEVLDLDNPEHFNIMHTQSCWMIAFEDAKMTPPEHKKHLTELGLTFRGAGQWIVADDFSPAKMPWLVEEKDLPFIMHCLRQAMDVAIRFKDNPGLMRDDVFLLRTPYQQDGALVWKDEYEEEDIEVPDTIVPIKIGAKTKAELKALPKIGGAVLLCSVLMPNGIQEKKTDRPWYPLLLVAIQHGSGFILEQELVPYWEMDQKVVDFLMRVFKNIGGTMDQLGIHHAPLSIKLTEFCAHSNIDLINLPGDDPEIMELMQVFRGMF
jgi:hypothetical protein